MKGRSDAGKEKCRKEGMQERRNAGKVGCRKEGMQEIRDAGKEGCWKGEMQKRRECCRSLSDKQLPRVGIELAAFGLLEKRLDLSPERCAVSSKSGSHRGTA